MRHLIQKPIVDNRKGKMSMYTFRDATHLGMTMPVKFLSLRHDDIEKSKLLLPFDGQRHNTMRLFDLNHDFTDFWYF